MRLGTDMQGGIAFDPSLPGLPPNIGGSQSQSTVRTVGLGKDHIAMHTGWHQSLGDMERTLS